MNARHNALTHTSARIGRLARLPVFFSLAGKRVVVAGDTAAAAWKMELLSACGATVDVYAPFPCEELLALAAAPPDGTVVLHPRRWQANDLRGAAIAVGDCEDEDAAGFVAAARAAGVPVNVIDKPAFCDFSFGAIVNRSPLVVGISTDGAAPVFAQAIRARIEALLPQGFAAWAAAASRWRAQLKATGLPFAARRRFWHLFTARALAAPERQPADFDFADLIAQVRALGAAATRGTVTTVSADPADAGLLTLHTVRALQSADILVHDDAIEPEILDFARREAQRIPVAPSRVGVAALMNGLAADGKRIVRLISDPRAASRARATRAAATP